VYITYKLPKKTHKRQATEIPFLWLPLSCGFIYVKTTNVIHYHKISHIKRYLRQLTEQLVITAPSIL